MIKILMYHAVGASQNSEAGARLYSVPVRNFEQQMEYIANLGIVPFGGSPFIVCGDSPCITFDDGDITNYKYAYPILKERGLKAYFFILAGKAGSEGYMDWKQIKELKDNGMIIGSHGMTHKILTELDDKELNYELKESKRTLGEKLGQAVEYLSIPRGFYNKKIINLAKEAGYRVVFTSNPKDNDGFRIGRIPVKGNWDIRYFTSVLNNGFSVKGRAEELIKNASKKILGTKNYDKLRNRILSKY